VSAKERVLHTPVNEADLEDLNIGDLIYLTGALFTMRDLSHKRIGEYVRKGQKLPVDLKGAAVFHCGPIMKKTGPDTWEAVAAGPTSSSRFSPFVRPLVEGAGVKIIVGKGSLFPEACKAIVENRALYALGVGGCAALYATRIKRVPRSYWNEFGMVDTLWEFEVDRFGPLTVGIDLKGRNYMDKMKRRLKENLGEIYRGFDLDPDFDFTWWPQAPAGTKRATEYSTEEE
jgi:tartrate/fumarate subfamily iron-sulfur-dependent hydro-lyase beta chain